MALFEVVGLDADRELIQTLAKRLAESSAEAAALRATVSRTLSGELPGQGGVLAALRHSPLVGADLDLGRKITPSRTLDV